MTTAKAGVYALRNTVIGRVYVGSSMNIEKRWNTHLATFRAGKQSPALQEDWNRHGEESFILTVLEIINEPTSSALEAAEHRWLEHIRSTTPETPYNIYAVSRSKKVWSPLPPEQLPEALVLALIGRLDAEGGSGAAFARRLEITKSYWHKVSHGQQQAGRKLIDGALSVYPDLAPLLIPDMRPNNEKTA